MQRCGIHCLPTGVRRSSLQEKVVAAPMYSFPLPNRFETVYNDQACGLRTQSFSSLAVLLGTVSRSQNWMPSGNTTSKQGFAETLLVV
jgi:hypothetical protein